LEYPRYLNSNHFKKFKPFREKEKKINIRFCIFEDERKINENIELDLFSFENLEFKSFVC
jgi:hypothetical protein